MKKILILALLGFLASCVLILPPARAFADHCREYSSPRQVVTASLFVFRPWSVGYRQRIARNVYLTGVMDYLKDDQNLRFQAGAIYRIPRRILFFRPYGGGGLEFSRNDGYMYPYVAVGLDFWIFYSEVSHPLRSEEEPTSRFGFRFSF